MQPTMSKDGHMRLSVRVTERLTMSDIAALYTAFRAPFSTDSVVEFAEAAEEVSWPKLVDICRKEIRLNGKDAANWYVGDNNLDEFEEAAFKVFNERYGYKFRAP